MTQILMIQGTTSDAGKTTLVAGIGRALARRGFSVAPFKPQNMALNSAVCPSGGEIGRAQALQAQACGVAAHVDMNPILLKPNSDCGAQVIVQGHSIGNMDARTYHAYKPTALQAVMASYARLCERYDFVLVEGAGSPAEINLRDGDIANMGFAETADCAVIVIADIDKGGVFAHLLGTLACLSGSERKRVQGFVINKFRGDPGLLDSGLTWLANETGKPVLGVLPYWQGLNLDAEDAIQSSQHRQAQGETLRVIVPVLPRISNHTDFDALRQQPQVDLQYIGPGQAIPAADLIIVPGSKNVRDDLQWLRANHWEAAIKRHLRYGGRVVGICGGMQMLGHRINDAHAVEGIAGCSRGLGVLDIETQLLPEKRLRETRGTLVGLAGDAPVRGYEIHCGLTSGAGLDKPAIQFDDGTFDGAMSPDQQILGTYLHGLFDSPGACTAILRWAGLSDPQVVDIGALREQGIERIADGVEASIDLHRLFSLPPPSVREHVGPR